jgi:hypothetical protein
MSRFVQILLGMLVVAGAATALYGQSYMWITEHETDQQGNRHPFRHGDTLDGSVISDDQISIVGDPVFTDRVITTARDFWRGPGYDPQFLGPLPEFNATPSIQIFTTAENLRAGAAAQGHYYWYPDKSYFAHFSHGLVKMAMWDTGAPMDTVTNTWTMPISHTCMFFTGPLHLYGIVQGEVTIGTSETMYIIDDVRYPDVNSRGRWFSPNGAHYDYLGLVSEGDIKIANTPANGRYNSSGRGVLQTNPDSTSIVITAAVVALGSFTFEQQNDPDSGYICTEPCGCDEDGQFGGPDDRGNLYLLGSITQKWRGYVHRSNCTSTGYQMILHSDQRMRNHRPPCFYSAPRQEIPDSVLFGDVALGQSVTDTAFFDLGEYETLGSVYASYPFSAVRLPPYRATHFDIPVHFTPPHLGTFSGVLTVFIGAQYFQIPIRGRGVHAAAPPIVLDVSPNPFNLTTTIRYSLPEGATGKLAMFDILGRVVREFDLTGQSGDRAISFNGANLATGVYFVRLETGGQAATRKILLLK